ncbi:hypothetical protein LSH36_860g00018 [Paralvinella palmiformis]|uniref:MULE transposase domain-containing protein n=1 Tax=Paralvinella palmiformis TaxID=53620 RepID=A0AAD9MT70_9ANNE|nr:hypothetical protein LSH36_860g00018 [Paralvinella palmiformis]
MGGTFSVGPLQFKQVYAIRAPIGTTAVSCVYALLTGKKQSVYEELIKAVVDKCQEYDLYPNPATVVSDFEKATLQATTSILDEHISAQVCFYHLTQSTWRKVQELGVSNAYHEHGEVRTFVGVIDSLAFLPVDRVSDGMQHLRDNILEYTGLDDLLNYFDTIYVTGAYRRVRVPAAADDDGSIPVVTMRRLPPQFRPHLLTLNDRTRTNNICESWNIRFKKLVGHTHPLVWTPINARRQDHAIASALILQD